MPKKLSEIDKHPQKEEIIQALIDGKSYRTITVQYGISATSVGRYMREKLSAQASQALEKRGEETGEMIVKQMDKIQSIVMEVLENERMKNNTFQILAAAREFRAGLEFLARIYGNVKEKNGDTIINVTQNNMYLELKDAVLKATEDNPEVRERIADAIASLNSR